MRNAHKIAVALLLSLCGGSLSVSSATACWVLYSSAIGRLLIMLLFSLGNDRQGVRLLVQALVVSTALPV